MGGRSWGAKTAINRTAIAAENKRFGMAFGVPPKRKLQRLITACPSAAMHDAVLGSTGLATGDAWQRERTRVDRHLPFLSTGARLSEQPCDDPAAEEHDGLQLTT